MKIGEWESITDETAVYPKEVKNFDLAYLFLGLIDELCELEDAICSNKSLGIAKESGDAYWYLAGLFKFLFGDIKLNTVLKNKSCISHFPDEDDRSGIKKELGYVIKRVARMSGNVKKYYRDGNENLGELDHTLRRVAEVLASVHSTFGFSTEEVLALNYDKLIARKLHNKLHGDGDER